MSDPSRESSSELKIEAAPDEAAAKPGDAPAKEATSPERMGPAALTPEQVAALLARVNVFSGLAAPYLRRIASLGAVEDYPAGAFVFREGSPGDKLYLILEGNVRISRDVSGMGEEALAVLQAGDYFGEMALIDDFPRSADARAHEPCRLLVIAKKDMEDLLFVDRDLAYDLLWNFVRTLSARLRGTNDKMTFLAVTSRF